MSAHSPWEGEVVRKIEDLTLCAKTRRIRPCPEGLLQSVAPAWQVFWKVDQPPCNHTKIGRVETR
jgi:hypothetical protein